MRSSPRNWPSRRAVVMAQLFRPAQPNERAAQQADAGSGFDRSLGFQQVIMCRCCCWCVLHLAAAWCVEVQSISGRSSNAVQPSYSSMDLDIVDDSEM